MISSTQRLPKDDDIPGYSISGHSDSYGIDKSLWIRLQLSNGLYLA